MRKYYKLKIEVLECDADKDTAVILLSNYEVKYPTVSDIKDDGDLAINIGEKVQEIELLNEELLTPR